MKAEGWNLFCGADADLLASYASEIAAIGSPSSGERDSQGRVVPAVKYYQRDKSKSFDPVYAEPTGDDTWRGPYVFPCTIEFEDAEGHIDYEVDAEGFDRIYDAIFVVTAENWRVFVTEAHDPAFKKPAEGDVIVTFDGFRSYIVERVEASGYVLTSNRNVEWRLMLRSRESFEPARLLPPGV